jgi:pyruvate dehydrogenase E2 component (dihydrolipoamide acetyltransferase)
MPIEILMPALSPTMTEGTLASWNKKEGDEIKSGDLIAEIETDKAIMEVESLYKGKIGKILVPAGTQGVKINTVIALVLEKNETEKDLDGFTPKIGIMHGASGEKKSDESVSETIKSVAKIEERSDTTRERVFASPLAKRIATEKSIDLCTISGSGPRGRVIRDDVLNAKSAEKTGMICTSIGRNSEEYRDVKNSGMRSVIANRLLESKQTIPHFYLDADCNLDNLLAARELINSRAPKKDGKPIYKISVNDIMVKCTALAIKNKSFVNCSYLSNSVRYYNNVDISIAVSIPDGLITPIVKNADQKGILEISAEIKDLASRARSGGLRSDEFQGGGFSISNLGMYGVKNFHAIVNPPQSCILAIGASEERAIVKNGAVSVANMVTISISVDHRAIDGSLAAEFLSELKAIIENPILALL